MPDYHFETFDGGITVATVKAMQMIRVVFHVGANKVDVLIGERAAQEFGEALIAAVHKMKEAPNAPTT